MHDKKHQEKKTTKLTSIVAAGAEKAPTEAGTDGAKPLDATLESSIPADGAGEGKSNAEEILTLAGGDCAAICPCPCPGRGTPPPAAPSAPTAGGRDAKPAAGTPATGEAAAGGATPGTAGAFTRKALRGTGRDGGRGRFFLLGKTTSKIQEYSQFADLWMPVFLRCTRKTTTARHPCGTNVSNVTPT